MSFEDKYEKVILGTGIVLLLGAGAWAALKNSSFDEKYALPAPIPNKNVPLDGVEKADDLLTNLESPHEISRPAIGKQYFDIFAGPMLINRKGSTTAEDLYTGAPVHKDIPNIWFIENGLEDVFKMSNAADVDSDNDGFTNYEEFQANTKPNDPTSFPDLRMKLQGVKLVAAGYELAYTMEPMTPEEPASFRADPINARPATQSLWRVDVKPGATFGGGDDEDRFRLVEITRKPRKDVDESVAIVEDLKPEKQGATYEIFYGRRNAQRIIDKSAVIKVNAGPNRDEFTVVEGKTFTIPGDPTKTVYFAENIDAATKTLNYKKRDGDEVFSLTF